MPTPSAVNIGVTWEPRGMGQLPGTLHRGREAHVVPGRVTDG